MKKIVVFFMVFVLTMIISTKILGSDNTESLFIKLLISGLIASIALWFITVRDEHDSADDF